MVKFHTPAISLKGNNPGADRIGHCLDSRADMKVLRKRKFSSPPGFRNPDCPARSLATISTTLHYTLPEKQYSSGKSSINIISTFRSIRKIAKSDYHIPLSVRPSTWNNSAPTGRIFMKFDIGEFFLKTIEKIQVSLKSDKNNGYFYEDH